MKKKKQTSKKKEDKPVIGFEQKRLRKHTRAFFLVSTDYARRKDVIVPSENISMGGAFLETHDPLPKGTKVKLRFPLKSAYRPFQIEGKVVWNRKDFGEGKLGSKIPGMGIVFANVNKQGQGLLKEFLDNINTYGWFLES